MTSISKIWNLLTTILSKVNNFHPLEVVDRVSETTSSGGKFQLNNLAVKRLNKIWSQEIHIWLQKATLMFCAKFNTLFVSITSVMSNQLDACIWTSHYHVFMLYKLHFGRFTWLVWPTTVTMVAIIYIFHSFCDMCRLCKIMYLVYLITCIYVVYLIIYVVYMICIH